MITVNVVLLSKSKDRVEAIRAASKRKGFACTVVQNDELASDAIERSSDEGILVVDSEAARDIDRILRARLPNWPVLVLAARFDSAAWVELFKAGASEVIGDPLDPSKLDAALDGFLPSKILPPSGLWNALSQWFRMR